MSSIGSLASFPRPPPSFVFCCLVMKELSGELGMRLRVNTQSFSTLKELFIAELAKAACTVAAEGSSKEVSYNHLGELKVLGLPGT